MSRFLKNKRVHRILHKSSIRKRLFKAFTLIELLVAVAVIGVIAAAIWVTIDPAEKMNRARDSKRKTDVNITGNSLIRYFISRNIYPDFDQLNLLTQSGELKSLPIDTSQINFPCGTDHSAKYNNSYCYKVSETDPSEVIVYTPMQSKNEKIKCQSDEIPLFAWSSKLSSAGIICTGTTNEPSTNITSFLTGPYSPPAESPSVCGQAPTSAGCVSGLSNIGGICRNPSCPATPTCVCGVW